MHKICTDFSSWLLQITKELNTKYIIKSVKKDETVTTKYYMCHGSSDVNLSCARKRKLKSLGSCEFNFNCTSTIKCRILSNNEHEVEFIKTHYGHQCAIEHQEISHTNSDEIASKLVAGVSEHRLT